MNAKKGLFMELTDVMVMYKRAKTEYDKRCIIDKIRMDSLLVKEVLEDFEAVLYIIDAKYYSILLEVISEHSMSSIIVEQTLPFLIKNISFYHLKPLIETLMRYYPDIAMTKYRKLCEKRLLKLCEDSLIVAENKLEMNYYYLTEVYTTGIFKHSLEHYLIDGIVIPRLENFKFSVSFRGKNKKFKDMIHNFIKRLQLDAWEDGLSNEVIYLGEGAYSIILQIGNQILKLGKGRDNNELIHSPELVEWRYRHYFKESGLFIEVQPLVDINFIQEEEVARLFISSYENGYYWSDGRSEKGFRKDNIGRLLSDNYLLRGRLNDNAEEIIDYQKSDKIVYKEGDCVIIDTDCYEKLNCSNVEEATIEYKSCLNFLGIEEYSINSLDSDKQKVKMRKLK